MHDSQLFCACHVDGEKRRCGASAFTTHTRSTQPAKDEAGLQSFARGGCVLPAQSAESTGCHVERRAKPVVETSRRSGTFTLTVRTGSRLFHPRDPSTVLGVTDRNGYAWLGVTKKCTYFVVNREKCTTFGTSDPPERRDSRCRYVNVRNLPV